MTRCSELLVETPPTCIALVTVMAAVTVIVCSPSLAAGTLTTPAASPLAPEASNALVARASTLPRLRSLLVSVDGEIVEAYIKAEVKTPWYIDLLNINLDNSDLASARERIEMYLGAFAEDGTRITRNLDFA